MNIVYLHAHDAGRFISPYREGLPTPNLERFAGESVVFTDAHCAAPTCSPSRAALLTGVSPHEAGMLGLAHRGFSLRNPERHLAAFLRGSGYETALSGIQHVFRREEAMPYDHVFRAERGGDYREYDLSIAGQAAEFLKREKEKPFFLDCGFWLPHRPFPPASAAFDPAAVELPVGFPDTEEVRNDYAEFLTGLESMDACAGIVLDALGDAGLDSETLVIFTTDHGIAFPGMKCNLTAAGTGVALMMRVPGGNGCGRRCEGLVSQLDLYPTICELAGLDAPEWLEGVSLRPLLEGGEEEVRREFFSEVTYHASYEPMRGVRTKTHNLVKIFDKDLSRVPANIDDSAAKEVLIDGGLLDGNRERVQLYDLERDPGEEQNLAEETGYSGVRADLGGRLDAWMEATGDPLLAGDVPLPEGAWCNPREHLSAEEGG